MSRAEPYFELSTSGLTRFGLLVRLGIAMVDGCHWIRLDHGD